MSTLYREYRPQNFKEVVGQNHIKITIEHEIELGKIAHAYLFCGPRGIGKTTMARVFAKAINCLKRKDGGHEPCNKCEICDEITAGRSLDIIEVDAASHTGVDNVRDNIIANARVAPSRCKFKVFIIDEVHMLSISAFNALLKTIEEPPANVIFILCTTEIYKVPTTIISRCQRFDFKRISAGDITKKLQYIADQEEIKIDKKILEAISRQSEGHMRDAESLLGQVVAIGGGKITAKEADLIIPRSDLAEVINLIDNLVKKNAGSAIGLINKLIYEGVDLKIFLTDLIELLRKIMLAKINPGLAEKLALELGESLEMQINKVSRDLNLNQAIMMLEKFIEVRNNLKTSFIIQLPMEIAIAELCIPPTSRNITEGEKKIFGDGKDKFFGAEESDHIKPFVINPSNSVVKSVENTVAGKLAVSANLNQDQMLVKWNEVLVKIKQYNHSLSFVLRTCQPKEINNQKLRLAFKYKIHKERIEDKNIKELVEKVLHEVYGLPLAIEAVVDEDLEIANNNLIENSPINPKPDILESQENSVQAKQTKKSDLVDNLLNIFGGKVVKGA